MKYLVQFSNETETWRGNEMEFYCIQKDWIDSEQLGLLARNIPVVVMDDVSLNFIDFEKGFFKNSSKFSGRCRKLKFLFMAKTLKSEIEELAKKLDWIFDHNLMW